MATRKKGLTEGEQAFLNALFRSADLNITEACKVAYPRQKYPAKYGFKVANRPHIKAAIDAFKLERNKRTEIDADFVLREHLALNKLGIDEIIDDAGMIKPISEWPDVAKRYITEIEVAELFDGQGDGKTVIGLMKKIKLPSKLKNLEMIGRHTTVQAYIEKVEVATHGQTVMVVPGCVSVGDWEKQAQQQQGESLAQ